MTCILGFRFRIDMLWIGWSVASSQILQASVSIKHY
jgi:hypothetical protein